MAIVKNLEVGMHVQTTHPDNGALIRGTITDLCCPIVHDMKLVLDQGGAVYFPHDTLHEWKFETVD